MYKQILSGFVLGVVLAFAGSAAYGQTETVTIGGRITRQSNGNGAGSIRVTAYNYGSNCSDTTSATSIANPFGYYTIHLENTYGCGIFVVPQYKGDQFDPQIRFLSPNDDLLNINFVDLSR